MTTQNASLRRRFGAIFYDCLLVFALLMMVATPFVAMRGGEAVEPLTDIVFRLSLGAVVFAFFVGFWTRSGRTLGMQSWGLQLEAQDGKRITFAAATVRFFAALLSLAALGLGYLWQLWDSEQLTWHDRLSKTRLVYYPKEKI